MTRLALHEYPVFCSWCLKNGKKTILNYINKPGSHGICEDCAAEMMNLKAIEDHIDGNQE